MRKKIWIPLLILLGLGSLIVSQGPFSISSAPDRTSELSDSLPSKASTAHQTQSIIKEISLDSPTRQNSPPEQIESPGADLVHSSIEIQESLDLATAEEIRRVLDEAIEREKLDRSLFVAQGIVEVVATTRRVRVIFETRSGLSEKAASMLLAGGAGAAEFDSLRVYPLLGRGAASVGPQALLHLIVNPETGQIELDAVHRPSLAETIPIIRADLAHQQGQDGDGFAIAVLDTGVDPTHPMYADRIIEEACFSVEKDCPNGQIEMYGAGAAAPCTFSHCGHGTRVAGIALGEDPGGRLTGAAPHADLIAIQIFSNVNGELGAYASDILAGLQHVLGLTVFYEIAAVNLSFGGALFTSQADCDQNVASQLGAVELLRMAGVLTVAASGNESSIDSITTPGCLSNVLAVGSTSDLDIVSSFSNSAKFLALLAPGEAIESSSLGGGTSTANGTSLAPPHVAGAIAAIREAIPDATADEIANALALTGLAVSDGRNGITTPRIQVFDAITLLEATLPPPDDPDDPPPDEGGGESSPAATAQSNGDGGQCGLIGIECFLVLAIVRFRRRRLRLRRPAMQIR